MKLWQDQAIKRVEHTFGLKASVANVCEIPLQRHSYQCMRRHIHSIYIGTQLITNYALIQSQAMMFYQKMKTQYVNATGPGIDPGNTPDHVITEKTKKIIRCKESSIHHNINKLTIILKSCCNIQTKEVLIYLERDHFKYNKTSLVYIFLL